MTNVELVVRKLVVLVEHVRRIRQRRPDDVAAFEADSLRQDAIAMSLLVVVQEAIDIALHIASDEGWQLAGSNREAFRVLEQHQVIDASLAASLASAVQLRNRMAHGYASLDAARLHAELPSGVTAFEAFASAVSAWLPQSRS
jgi:uncharacterized protein YutE (UPF0331/DUF86 family)